MVCCPDCLLSCRSDVRWSSWLDCLPACLLYCKTARWQAVLLAVRQVVPLARRLSAQSVGWLDGRLEPFKFSFALRRASDCNLLMKFACAHFAPIIWQPSRGCHAAIHPHRKRQAGRALLLQVGRRLLSPGRRPAPGVGRQGRGPARPLRYARLRAIQAADPRSGPAYRGAAYGQADRRPPSRLGRDGERPQGRDHGLGAGRRRIRR